MNADILHALSVAVRCVARPDEHWKVPSEDEFGQPLTLIAVIEDGVLVVTVY